MFVKYLSYCNNNMTQNVALATLQMNINFMAQLYYKISIRWVEEGKIPFPLFGNILPIFKILIIVTVVLSTLLYMSIHYFYHTNA